MSSPAHPLRAMAALMVAVVLAPAGFLGVVGVFTDTGPMRPVFGMLAVAGGMGVFGAVRTLREVIAASRTEYAVVADARRATPAGFVVAKWSVEGGAARAFAEGAWRDRKIEVVAGAAGLFVLGGVLLLVLKGPPVWAAFAASAFLGSLYLGIGLAKYGMEYHAAIRPAARDVIVLPDAIVVLGTVHALSGDRTLRGVALGEEALELTIEWPTRDGKASDTISAPVPPYAREQAEAAVAFLRQRIAETTG